MSNQEPNKGDQREPLASSVKDNPLPSSGVKPLNPVSTTQPPKPTTVEPRQPSKPAEANTKPVDAKPKPPVPVINPMDNSPQAPKSVPTKPDLKANLQPIGTTNNPVAAPRMISKPPVLDDESIDF